MNIEHLIASLPGWALFLLVALWLFFEKGLPKLRGRARGSNPPHGASLEELMRAVQAEVVANREIERRQLEIMETLSRVTERSAEQRERQTDTLAEIRSHQKLEAQTLEAIYRRMMDDTSRFPLPRDR